MRVTRRITLATLLGVPVLGLLGLAIWGLLLPPASTTAGIVEIAAPPAAVFERVVDPSLVASWQPGVRVRDIGRVGGRQRFQVEGPRPYRYDLVSSTPPERIELALVPDRGVEGTIRWTFEPLDTGTRVILVHDARVTAPLERVRRELTRSPSRALQAQLTALAHAFEQEQHP